jgi:HK97 family phage major capsid protein
MQEQLKKAIARQKEILNLVKKENRIFNETEREEWNSLQTQIENLKAELELVENEDFMNSPANQPTFPVLGSSGPQNNNPRLIQNLFKGETFDNGGFKTAEEFMNVAFSGKADDRIIKIQNSGSANTGIGSEGGIVIPTEFSKIYWDRSLESEIIRPKATVWKMLSNERLVPMFNSQDTSTSIFGFISQWLPELGTATVQVPNLRGLKLKADKLGIFTSLSREISQDGLDFNKQLETAMVKAIGWSLDWAFLRGSGIGQPLGILNSGCKIVVNRSALNSVSYADLAKMHSKLLPGSFSSAFWVINQTALEKLTLMTDTGGNLLWTYGKTLFGLPVVITEKLPTLGSQGDVILIDPSFYCIGMRQEVQIDTSNAPGWTNDSISVRGLLRIAGIPMFSQPIKQADSNEVSPFVVLGDVVPGDGDN